MWGLIDKTWVCWYSTHSFIKFILFDLYCAQMLYGKNID